MLIMRIDRRALLATALAAPSVLRERPAAAADDPPWMIMAGQDSGPSGRWDHSLILDTWRNRLLVVGGRDIVGAVADNLWSFDIGTYTWSELHLSGPEARFGSAAAAASDGSGFYYFGGESEYAVFDDLWWFDFASTTWQQIQPGRGPGARSGAKGVIDGQGRFVISHGSYGPMFFDDTWAFDSSKGVWTGISPQGQRPLGRYHHNLVALPEYGSMLLFGGQAWLRQGDLWVYDFDSASWSDVTPAVGPSPRTGAAMAALGTTLLLVGGDSGLGFMSDVWRGYFDGYTVGWTELTLVNHGPMGIYRRAWHDMTAANGEYYVFGGAGVEDALGDLWRFSLDRFTESDHSLEPSGDDSSDA